jgi:hypothetical protein
VNLAVESGKRLRQKDITPECQGNDDYPDDDSDPFEEPVFIVKFKE